MIPSLDWPIVATSGTEALLGNLKRRGEPFALLCVDLDKFKPVNDRHGHAAGDTVLETIARRLRGLVNGNDVLARLGGDEFAIVKAALRDCSQAAAFAEQIIEQTIRPIQIGKHEILVGASIGIALAPDNGTDVDRLQTNADLALYRAKHDGRNGYRCFTIEMDVERRIRAA